MRQAASQGEDTVPEKGTTNCASRGEEKEPEKEYDPKDMMKTKTAVT